jgi:hypothetical protein
LERLGTQQQTSRRDGISRNKIIQQRCPFAKSVSRCRASAYALAAHILEDLLIQLADSIDIRCEKTEGRYEDGERGTANNLTQIVSSEPLSLAFEVPFRR